MFTGIVQAIGRVRSLERRGGDVRLAIDCGELDLSDVRTGDSIAVAGCCLTAVALQADGFAADKLTLPGMAMLIRECSGIVCLCLTAEKSASLGLRPMVENNRSQYGTAFTVSIEARTGVSTGVSAADRITTIRAAIAPDADTQSVVSPGHVFPLVAKEGGVLARRGHTEGSVDLARLAGLPPAAVLCELMLPDGTMARRDDAVRFADQHNLPVLTIEDIVQYREQMERAVSFA
jgi:3,4-dihydroxy 2-butanone 4-phosphate synthase